MSTLRTAVTVVLLGMSHAASWGQTVTYFQMPSREFLVWPSLLRPRTTGTSGALLMGYSVDESARLLANFLRQVGETVPTASGEVSIFLEQLRNRDAEAKLQFLPYIEFSDAFTYHLENTPYLVQWSGVSRLWVLSNGQMACRSTHDVACAGNCVAQVFIRGRQEPIWVIRAGRPPPTSY